MSFAVMLASSIAQLKMQALPCEWPTSDSADFLPSAAITARTSCVGYERTICLLPSLSPYPGQSNAAKCSGCGDRSTVSNIRISQSLELEPEPAKQQCGEWPGVTTQGTNRFRARPARAAPWGRRGNAHAHAPIAWR